VKSVRRASHLSFDFGVFKGDLELDDTKKLPPRIWLRIVDDHQQMMMLTSCGEKRQETFHASKKGKVPLSTSTNNEKLKNVV
jgi:hypothetical protein